MENKFTQKAQNALIFAASQAQAFGHTYIGSEHLLLGLLGETNSVASKMLAKKGSFMKRSRRIYLRTQIRVHPPLFHQTI